MKGQRAQCAATDAHNGDMGITSLLIPGESIEYRSALGPMTGDALEVTDEIVDLVTFYTQTPAVPAAKEAHGHDLFIQTQCSRCHILRLEKSVMSDLPEVSSQIIFACTDLLLHNMGEALADGRRDFRATGSE